MAEEKISCYSVLGHQPNEKISCLLSHEKFSCLKRKSNDLSVWGPLPMRKSPVSCLMRKSHVSGENLMSQEKISCIFSFWSPPTRKSPVSCLMRISHVSRENIAYLLFANSIPLCLLTAYLLSAN